MALVYVADSVDAPRSVFLQNFDAWGRAVHSPWLVESIDDYSNSLAVLAFADQTWIAWSQADGSWLRRVGSHGAPLAPRQLLDDLVPNSYIIYLATNGNVAAAEFSTDLGPPYGAFGRFFTPDGSPQSELFAIAASDSTHGFQHSRCAVSPNGTTFFAYNQHWPTNAAFYRIGAPGQPLGPQMPLTPPGDGSWPFANQDGSFLVCSISNDAPGAAHVHRITADGTISTTAPLPSGFLSVTGDALGDFALLFDPIDELPSVQLFDATPAVVTARIPFTRSPSGRNPTREGSPRQMTDGTFWIAWSIRSTDPIEFYLTMLKPFVPGDLDGDGRLTNFDIDPFVTALVDRPSFATQYPVVPVEAVDVIGDMNGDSRLDNFDIDPFVEALLHLAEP